MDMELIVLAYNQEGKAREVLQAMKQLQKDRIISILNAAVLVKNKDGKTSLTETEDMDVKHGALFGAITGGLVGLLGGPSGVIVGAAAGAATGGVAARVMDMGFPDEYMRDLQQGLRPGSSAIVALVEDNWVERFAEAVEEYGGQLFRQALKAEIAAQLTAAAGAAGNVKEPTAQARLEARLKELQAQIAELKAQAAKAGADAKANLDKQIADLRAKLEATWDELRAQLEAQYQARGTEIAELETQAAKVGAQAKADYEQRIAALRAKRDAIRDKLRAQLEAELQELEAEIKELKAQAAKVGAETKAELDKQIAALRTKQATVREKLQAIK
jgi:uncharacterized membrane protein